MKPSYSFACMIVFLSAMLAISSCTSSDNAAADPAQDSLQALISRGDYLVNSACHCMHCHSERDFSKFAGPVIPGTEGMGGEQIEPGIFVRNITPYALGDWTDEEIFRVLTTGINKHGDTLTLVMPYWAYRCMPKEDVYSIIAYLRTLKPIENNVRERDLGESRPFWSAAYKTFMADGALQKFDLSSLSDKTKRGEYLVKIGICTGCHSTFNPELMGFDPERYLSGGNLFSDSLLDIRVNTANITPDTLTGIGGWSEEVFLAKFKMYRDSANYSYDPGKHNTFMPWTFLANLDDEDLSALYAYLRSIKPVSNKVEKWPQ